MSHTLSLLWIFRQIRVKMKREKIILTQLFTQILIPCISLHRDHNVSCNIILPSSNSSAQELCKVCASGCEHVTVPKVTQWFSTSDSKFESGYIRSKSDILITASCWFSTKNVKTYLPRIPQILKPILRIESNTYFKFNIQNFL